MKKWQWTLLTAIYGLQIVLGFFIKYPPTEEQLKILLFFHAWGNLSLWILRIFSLCALWLIFKIWKRIVSNKIYAWSILTLSISPAIFNLWYLYPILLIKIFLIVWVFSLIKPFKKWWLILFLILGLIAFNRYILGEKAAIFNKFSLDEAQNEVMIRFTKEDSLKEKIDLPLWWRRISYNKFFFVYKGVVAEVLPYFDLETLYFQEVSPTEQKSMVMFYWPEILVLMVGIYFWSRQNTRQIRYLFLLSIFDYVFSEGALDRRLLLTMWPLSIVMATAWVEIIMLAKNKYILAKWSLGIVGGLMVLAFAFNFYDLKVREEYWFDNRPLAFQFWFENLEKLNFDNYKKIYISSIVGDGRRYCYFYIGKKCDDSKWIFNSFDLKTDKVENKTIYAGFAGEFVGSDFKNNINSDWKNEAEAKGLKFYGIKSLLNTIAYKYGNDIGVAVEKINEK